MNETIGAKGGYNDKRRTLIITKQQKEKLIKKQRERDLKKLEEKVKKKQIYTLIKTLPISIGGTALKVLYENAIDKNKEVKTKDSNDVIVKEEYEEKVIVKKETDVREKKVVIADNEGKKIIVKVPIVLNKKIIKYPIKKEEIIKEKEENKESKNEIKEEVKDILKKEEIKKEKKEINNDISFDELKPELKEKLNKLKSRKIIDEYEKQLKDIRYDLRQLISDYNVLVDEGEKSVSSSEAENVLDRLSEVIWKVEELKNKIKIDNLDKYDDNYIYTLIEDYLLEFKDKKFISEIKDSPLYVLISSKLDELDTKKDDLKNKVSSKKEELKEKEESFDKLKDKYYSIDKINKDLVEFQKEQEMYLEEIKRKIEKSVTIEEKVEVEVEAMSRQSRRLLRRLTLAMLFPGTKAARGLALTTAAYLNYTKALLNPKTVTKKYKIVTVEDYGKSIENSIESIDNAESLLRRTDKEIDKLISKIKNEFRDYVGLLDECDKLLSNLQRIKSNINEKEYEMEKLKLQQKRQLEINNSKVLTRGKYPV